MCSRLDSRWLISACDTIVDHFSESDEVATALTGILFMNTIKLYETEYLLQQQTRLPAEMKKVTSRVELFDGMSAFVVGSGDMVKNMLTRVSRHSHSRIASPILNELILRAKKNNTVYNRLLGKHIVESTCW